MACGQHFTGGFYFSAPINPVKIPTKPLASRGSSNFNGTEIAFAQTKNPIYSFNKLVKKECKAISYSRDPLTRGSGFNEDLLRPSFTGLEE
ncbi:MAG: hypothetical protein JXR36_13550 [Bacteroidales bacterium]|nr:hypothetical protein [Bacteroidales bacterium]